MRALFLRATPEFRDTHRDPNIVWDQVEEAFARRGIFESKREVHAAYLAAFQRPAGAHFPDLLFVVKEIERRLEEDHSN